MPHRCRAFQVARPDPHAAPAGALASLPTACVLGSEVLVVLVEQADPCLELVPHDQLVEPRAVRDSPTARPLVPATATEWCWRSGVGGVVLAEWCLSCRTRSMFELEGMDGVGCFSKIPTLVQF